MEGEIGINARHTIIRSTESCKWDLLLVLVPSRVGNPFSTLVMEARMLRHILVFLNTDTRGCFLGEMRHVTLTQASLSAEVTCLLGVIIKH